MICTCQGGECLQKKEINSLGAMHVQRSESHGCACTIRYLMVRITFAGLPQALALRLHLPSQGRKQVSTCNVEYSITSLM